jgi:sulfur carrier protein
MTAGTERTLKVNGRIEALHSPTIAALLAERGITAESRGVAVAHNGAVVPRTCWAEVPLAADDEIEIIKAMSGG